MCHGLCIEHTALNGWTGPFHGDFNDDCIECCNDVLRGAARVTELACPLGHDLLATVKRSYGARITELEEARAKDRVRIASLQEELRPFTQKAYEAEQAIASTQERRTDFIRHPSSTPITPNWDDPVVRANAFVFGHNARSKRRP